MKRASIGLLLSLHLLVYIHHTYTCTEARSTIGAVVDTPRTLPGAMANANGSSQDSDLSSSTFQNQATLSCAIASSQPTLPSVVVLTSTCTGGVIEITEVSGPYGQCLASGAPSPTGCLPSTSETITRLER